MLKLKSFAPVVMIATVIVFFIYTTSEKTEKCASEASTHMQKPCDDTHATAQLASQIAETQKHKVLLDDCRLNAAAKPSHATELAAKDAAMKNAFLSSFEAEQRAFCRQQVFLGTHPRSSRVEQIGVHKGVDKPYPAYVYASGDIVSDSIRTYATWEMSKWEMMFDKMMEKASEWNLPREEVGFMDFGANIGWFTNLAAAAGFQTYSFEAMPMNEIILRSTLCANPEHAKRVHLTMSAMGDRVGKCVLKSAIPNAGNGVLDCSPDAATTGGENVMRVEVPVMSLDHLFYETTKYSIKFLPRIAVVKMDIEGFEPFVVRGGQRFFKEMRIPYITTEINGDMPMETRKTYLQQWYDLGYDIRRANWTNTIIPPSEFGSPDALTKEDEIYISLRAH